jgi:hypothetical protein
MPVDCTLKAASMLLYTSNLCTSFDATGSLLLTF